jgi:UDP-glucose:(heptosyl)LPS alpha-1,3-glucosyltransferase
MRIAVLRQRVSGAGGAETTLAYLVGGLAAAGHEVTVLGTEAPEAGRRALGSLAAYQAVPAWGGKTGRLLSYALNSRRALRVLKPDVVFSLERTLFQHVYRAGDGCHREWLARRWPSRSPAGRLGQALAPFHRAMLWLEGRLLAAPELKRVIANAVMVREDLVRHYRIPRDKVALVYNGVDRRRFFPLPKEAREEVRRRLGAGPRDLLVVFVGSGFARKGLAYLLEACARLKEERARLWVVGKGSPRRYLARARRLGLNGRVRFWGPVAEAAAFYQAADLLALPTLYDPCSNVVLEALACGCPVVTTAGNGAAEFVTAGENGAVVADPRDTADLALALQLMLSRSGDPRVEAAALAAVASLSWAETAARTLAVLEAARKV